MTQRFYYKQDQIKRSKMYGCLTMRCTVYTLDENGVPHKIGFIDYNTGSTRGSDSEVFYFLTEKGLIPKEYYEKSAYYYDSGAYKEYSIHQLM